MTLADVRFLVCERQQPTRYWVDFTEAELEILRSLPFHESLRKKFEQPEDPIARLGRLAKRKQ